MFKLIQNAAFNAWGMQSSRWRHLFAHHLFTAFKTFRLDTVRNIKIGESLAFSACDPAQTNEKKGPVKQQHSRLSKVSNS